MRFFLHSPLEPDQLHGERGAAVLNCVQNFTRMIRRSDFRDEEPARLNESNAWIDSNGADVLQNLRSQEIFRAQSYRARETPGALRGSRRERGKFVLQTLARRNRARDVQPGARNKRANI